jgi:hypothetical protein
VYLRRRPLSGCSLDSRYREGLQRFRTACLERGAETGENSRKQGDGSREAKHENHACRSSSSCPISCPTRGKSVYAQSIHLFLLRCFPINTWRKSSFRGSLRSAIHGLAGSPAHSLSPSPECQKWKDIHGRAYLGFVCSHSPFEFDPSRLGFALTTGKAARVSSRPERRTGFCRLAGVTKRSTAAPC